MPASGKLPSLERLTVSRGRFHRRPAPRRRRVPRPSNWTSTTDPQLLYKPQQAEGAWLEIPFEVEKKEPLRLLLNATKSYDFGTYQASLNGVKLGGPLDFYSAKVANEEVHLLDFWPEPGPYTLRLECVGQERRSPAATTAAWNPSASASAGRAWPRWPTTRTRTGSSSHGCTSDARAGLRTARGSPTPPKPPTEGLREIRSPAVGLVWRSLKSKLRDSCAAGAATDRLRGAQ